jgi:hypothetical protein
LGKTVRSIATVIGAAALIIATGGLAAGFAGFAVSGLGFSTFLSIGTLFKIGVVGLSIGLAPKPPKLQAARELAERLSITANPAASRSVIFGRVGIAGQVLFRKNVDNSGSRNDPDEVLLVLALAGYPVTSLEKMWLNDDLIYNGEITGSGVIIDTPNVAAQFFDGSQNGHIFTFLDAYSTEWASQVRKLRGIPCVGMRIKVTESLKGRLEPMFQVKGAKLYDPRLDTTVGGSGSHRYNDPATWAWSDNPKLAELLYLRGASVNGVRIFGMGKPASAIDLENFATEASICDEAINVVGGGTIKRYTCNGILNTEADHRSNLAALLTASAGSMDSSDGTYRTFAGSWRAPSMTLTEADVDGAPTEMVLERDHTDETNVINGSFADINDKWRVKEYPELRDETSISAIGENRATLDLPFTNDHRIAQRIAKIEMLRSNAQKSFSANYWLRAMPLQPGDVVTQTYTRYGFSADTMRVASWGLQSAQDRFGNSKLVIPMTLVTERQSWFDWDYLTEEAPLESGVASSLPASNNRQQWSLASLGSNVLNEAGAILEDIDVRNDQLVISALSALNFNPSLQIPRSHGSGLAPAGWFTGNSTTNLITYLDPDVRDIMRIQSNRVAVGTAFRVNPDTVYEVVALARASTGTRPIALRVERTTSNLTQGQVYVGQGVGEPGFATRTALTTLTSPTVGTTYTLIAADWDPPAGTLWASPSIFSGVDAGEVYVDWCIVREKSTRNVLTRATTAPSGPRVGDIWYDTTNELQYTWNGTSWVLFAPEGGDTATTVTASGSGTTTASATIVRGGGITHVRVTYNLSGTATAGTGSPYPVMAELRRGGSGGTVIARWNNLYGYHEPGGGGDPDGVDMQWSAGFVDTNSGTGSTQYHLTVTGTAYTEACTVEATQTYFS